MKKIICKHCKKEFLTYSKKQVACSISCANKIKWSTGVLKGRARRGVYKDCLYCGGSFYVKQSKVTGSNFCSCRCSGKYRYHTRKEIADNLMTFKASGGRKKRKPYKKRKGMMEHRCVAEQKYKRKLLTNEEVHHVDGDHHNNSPNNLVILSRSEHRRLHFLERYKKEQEK